MGSLEEQKIAGLVECQIGIEQRDKEKALHGIDQFINISLLEISLDWIMDEAERWDSYCDDWEVE